MLDPLVTEALDRLQAETDQAKVWSVGRDLFARCGSRWLTFGSAPAGRPEAPLIRTDTTQALMNDYIGAEIYRHDPWMQHCATTPEPDRVDLRHDPGLARRPVPALMREVMLGHGIHGMVLIPCYRGTRSGGVVVYADGAETWEGLTRDGAIPRLRLLSAIFASVFRPEEDAGREDAGGGRLYRPQGLTAREAEALTWLAAGLQTGQIAERMGLAPVTVVKHFASARRRLGARTREQALAIALRDRLIRP